MCWDGDRGLAVGWQTADAVLLHQTSQSRLSLSCLLSLPLSLTHTHTHTVTHTHKHNNAHFFWSHCQNSKTWKGSHTRAHTHTHTHTSTHTHTHTHTSRHIHTDIYSSPKKSWIKFRQPLLKPTLWDVKYNFLVRLENDSKQFFSLLKTESSRASWSYLPPQTDTGRCAVCRCCMYVTECNIKGALMMHRWEMDYGEKLRNKWVEK